MSYVVNVIDVSDGEVTGTFGPMTEKEADEFCDKFLNQLKEFGKEDCVNLSIVELSDPSSIWHEVHQQTKELFEPCKPSCPTQNSNDRSGA